MFVSIFTTFVFMILIFMLFLLFMWFWFNVGEFFLLLVDWRDVGFRILFEFAFQNFNTYSLKFVITPMSFKTINFVIIKIKIISLDNSLIKNRIEKWWLNRIFFRSSIPFLSSQSENISFFIVSPSAKYVKILTPT